MEVLYAGTHSEYLSYRAPYLAHWRLFEKAKKMGIRRCNLGGVEGTLDDGLSVFKGKFPYSDRRNDRRIRAGSAVAAVLCAQRRDCLWLKPCGAGR